MRELPTIELTEEQTEEAERIRDILAAKSAVVVDYMSRLLASRKDRELFGETEFQIRDAVHRLGAEGLDAALAERKKRGTKDRASSARSVDVTPNS
jgi:hypothetical protein